MIWIKDQEAIKKMSKAGFELAAIFDNLETIVLPGVTTADIDAFIAEQLKKRDLISMTKGFMGYQHVSCISINDQVVHGMPNTQRIIMQGDLVKVDICASLHGYAADMARPFCMGSLSVPKAQQLVEVAQQALDAGIAHARAGNRLSDISSAIQTVVEGAGFGIVRDFAGHGIGKRMHEDPEILNYGKPGKGPILRAGMALAIEPMITIGDYAIYIDHDGWTAKTVDHSWAMHIEDTIVVTDGEPLILTRRAPE
jgi:methionyl aminopeptidase